MGHNVSDRRLAEIRARNAADARRGWLIDSAGRATPVDTPFGLVARRAVLEGGCSRDPTCRRRVVFDASAWIAQGMGEMSIFELQRSYGCGLVGCRLTWRSPSYPGGLPLAAFLDKPASISITCLGCTLVRKTFTVTAFLALIEKAGTGGLATSTVDMPGSLIRGACRRCEAHKWSISLWCPPPRLQTPSKPEGEKCGEGYGG